MKTETEEANQQEAEESQLCVSCVFPNDLSAHFCAKCGAPLSSYAATAPFERLFAEGHVYRRAVEQPRSLMVVAGVWVIFGTTALTGSLMLLPVYPIHSGWPVRLDFAAVGVVMIAVSIAVIWKTTRNYASRRKSETSAAVEPPV